MDFDVGISLLFPRIKEGRQMASRKAPTETQIEKLKVMVRPLGDRVLVLPDEASNRTPGGIHLPVSAEEVPHTGLVVRVGPGKLREGFATKSDPLETVDQAQRQRYPMDVTEGNRVYYSKFAGVDIKLGESTLKLLREDDVLAVMGE